MGYGFINFWSLGLLPGEFALPTGYGDVIVGLLAPVVAFIYYKRAFYAKKVAILWNYLGIADLVLSITLGNSYLPSTVSNASDRDVQRADCSFPISQSPSLCRAFISLTSPLLFKSFKKNHHLIVAS